MSQLRMLSLKIGSELKVNWPDRLTGRISVINGTVAKQQMPRSQTAKVDILFDNGDVCRMRIVDKQSRQPGIVSATVSTLLSPAEILQRPDVRYNSHGLPTRIGGIYVVANPIEPRQLFALQLESYHRDGMVKGVYCSDRKFYDMFHINSILRELSPLVDPVNFREELAAESAEDESEDESKHHSFQLPRSSSRNNNKDSCTFASSCMDQNGILKNNKTCSCGSIHCTKTSGLYCRNQEQYDLAPLQYPCTINKPRPMCSNYEGILPNVKECQCGTNVCNIHTGLMCKANENKCKKSEGCSVQAVEAMHEQQTCATFSPRCECSECMEGHYGRKCKKCPENATIAWFYDLAVVAFCVYVSGGVLYYVFRPSNKKYKGSSMQAKKQMTQLVKVAKLGSSMATVIIAQIQILSIIMSMIVWSPSLPDWLVVYLDYLGNIFSINFVGFLSSFECTRSSTPLQRWYVSLGLPYMIAFTFILWFYSSKLWFGCKITKMDSTLNDEEKVKIKAIHKYAHLITYEIIMEAAVNVLLIGMFKTVATTAMQIFDCTPMFDEYGNQQVSKLIMDVGKLYIFFGSFRHRPRRTSVVRFPFFLFFH